MSKRIGFFIKKHTPDIRYVMPDVRTNQPKYFYFTT